MSARHLARSLSGAAAAARPTGTTCLAAAEGAIGAFFVGTLFRGGGGGMLCAESRGYHGGARLASSAAALNSLHGRVARTADALGVPQAALTNGGFGAMGRLVNPVALASAMGGVGQTRGLFGGGGGGKGGGGGGGSGGAGAGGGELDVISGAASKAAASSSSAADVSEPIAATVGPGKYCCHAIDTHLEPAFLELNGIL